MSQLNVTSLKHEGASEDNITLSSNSNVGIGTSSPAEKLSVSGRVFVSGSGYTTNPTGLVLGQYASNDVYIQKPSGAKLSFWDSATNAQVTIDSAGRVTMPYQPAFAARGCSNPSTNSYVTGLPADLVFYSIGINNGGHYNGSNGRFTAPVSGMYYFAWNILVDDNAGSGSISVVRLYVNGSDTGFTTYDQNPGSRYQMMSQSCVRYMNAGDYATCRGTGGFIHAGTETVFTGFLLG